MDPEAVETEFDTVFFENGDYYEGQVLGRTPHGEGTMYYSTGETVSGKWIYGEHILGKRDVQIPESSKTTNRFDINGRTIYAGYTYTNDEISSIFSISRFIRGIRTHREYIVLFSTGESIYKDGIGWEKDFEGDSFFVYTGEGLQGDQKMERGNLALNNSYNKRIFLFVRRKPGEYVFHGEVIVKRYYTANELDTTGRMRKTFKFDLVRV